MEENSLVYGLLRDIRATQIENAEKLGEMKANYETMSVSVASHGKRVEELEEKGWKQTGFIMGAVAVAEPMVHYVKSKLGF